MKKNSFFRGRGLLVHKYIFFLLLEPSMLLMDVAGSGCCFYYECEVKAVCLFWWSPHPSHRHSRLTLLPCWQPIHQFWLKSHYYFYSTTDLMILYKIGVLTSKNIYCYDILIFCSNFLIAIITINAYFLVLIT